MLTALSCVSLSKAIKETLPQLRASQFEMIREVKFLWQTEVAKVGLVRSYMACKCHILIIDMHSSVLIPERRSQIYSVTGLSPQLPGRVPVWVSRYHISCQHSNLLWDIRSLLPTCTTDTLNDSGNKFRRQHRKGGIDRQTDEVRGYTVYGLHLPSVMYPMCTQWAYIIFRSFSPLSMWSDLCCAGSLSLTFTVLDSSSMLYSLSLALSPTNSQ